MWHTCARTHTQTHADTHTHALLAKWQKMKAASKNDFPLKAPLKDPCQTRPNFPNTSLELFGEQHDYHNVHNMVWRYAGTSILSWVFFTPISTLISFYIYITMWRRCNRAEFHSQALLNDYCQICLFHKGKTRIINKGRVYCWQVSLFLFP